MTGRPSSGELSRTVTPAPSNQMLQRILTLDGAPIPGTLQRSPSSGSNQSAPGSGQGSGQKSAPSAQPSPPAQVPLTVSMPKDVQGVSTPPEMKSNRIPPRVDTSVDIELKGTLNPSTPVVLSIEGQGGGHGAATIDGQPTRELAATGTVTVKLSGTDQTAPKKAGHLRLVATQQGKQLASSDGFSVSAIPQDVEFNFARLVKGKSRGIVVRYNWQSDSQNKSDLDQAPHSERVEHNPTGCMSRLDPHTSCWQPSTTPLEDEHSIVVKGLKCKSGTGKDKVSQTFMFRDDRTGDTNIPVRKSGFIIEHILQQKQDNSLQVVTTKNGADTTAKDPNPKCKSGPISSKAGSGSTQSDPQDV